ncbi:MAG: universal stress protein, partial [Actinobacteria bacterium]|nr:universal stress protein [Actinomycetota bacterium]
MSATVIVPLDGSDLSESALPVAEQLRSGLEGSITLLTSGWGSTVSDLEGYLSANAAMLDAPCTTVVVPDTFPATAIADSLGSPTDLVVMATHGRSGIGRALLGSVAEDLLRRTDNTVVLLGPKASADTPIPGGRLLVTTDGSPRSAMILPTASRFARALQMEVIVVTVGPPGGDDSTEELARAAAASVGFFRSEGGDATHQHLVGTDVVAAITALAEQLPAALIAMSTHGRGGIGRTTLGSTTMKVVHS